MPGPNMKDVFQKVGQQQQKTINLKFEDLKLIACQKCGNRVFMQAVELRHATAIQCGVPGGKNIPIPVFICMNCKHPHFTVPQPEEVKKDGG